MFLKIFAIIFITKVIANPIQQNSITIINKIYGAPGLKDVYGNLLYENVGNQWITLYDFNTGYYIRSDGRKAMWGSGGYSNHAHTFNIDYKGNDKYGNVIWSFMDNNNNAQGLIAGIDGDFLVSNGFITSFTLFPKIRDGYHCYELTFTRGYDCSGGTICYDYPWLLTGSAQSRVRYKNGYGKACIGLVRNFENKHGPCEDSSVWYKPN